MRYLGSERYFLLVRCALFLDLLPKKNDADSEVCLRKMDIVRRDEGSSNMKDCSRNFSPRHSDLMKTCLMCRASLPNDDI